MLGQLQATLVMNSFAFLVTPAMLGLIAGVAHGVVSHYADLPLALTDQVKQSVSIERFSSY